MPDLTPQSPAPGPKRFKRKLTTFLCQEMLYDYATGHLDGERRQAVEEFLQSDKECQELLQNIFNSLEYVGRFSQTALQPDVLTQLREAENALSMGRRYSKWQAWPETFRWSVTAAVISVLIAGIVSVVPWQKVQNFRTAGGTQSSAQNNANTVELAKIPDQNQDGLKGPQEGGVQPNEVDALAANETSGDEAPDSEGGAPDASGGASSGVGAEPAADSSGDGDEVAVPVVAARPPPHADVAATALRAKPDVSQKTEPQITEPMIAANAWNSVSAALRSSVVTPPPTLPPSEKAKKAAALAALTQTKTKSANLAVAAPSPSEAVAVVEKPQMKATKEIATASAKPRPQPTSLSDVAEDTDSGTRSSDAQTSEQTEATGATEAGAEKKEGRPKGFVYRAFMNVHDLDTVGPKITELIQELGGVKAGEVELGWKRGNSVRYYHFALPAENQEKLREQLQTYGPVRLSKDPHPRVMPEGQVRFILWLESAN